MNWLTSLDQFHHYKHGRYPIPNDDTEQNREDMKHALHLELTEYALPYFHCRFHQAG